MDKSALKGSPSRDEFKFMHKKLCKQFYACDLDLILIAKYPFRIVAFLDFKRQYEEVTFSEVVVYNIVKKIAPIFIIRGKDAATGPFSIFEFQNGNPIPDPPIVELNPICQCETWADLEEWEWELRRQ